MTPYDDNFYKNMYNKTRYSAEKILKLVLEATPNVHSLVDVGCGVGGWLAVAKELGIQEIQGIDGNWVRRDALVIPPECFQEYDLKQEFKPARRFDLAITLEVAEHLTPESSATFVATLTNLADVILFSAAIPYQGGVHHVNEQWPDYWASLFKQRGYLTSDYMRKRIWNDDNIHGAYRQNALLFVKETELSRYPALQADRVESPMPLVHPIIFTNKMRVQQGVRGSFRLFRRACASWCGRRLFSRPS